MKFINKSIENSWILYMLLFLSCMNFMGRGPIFFFLFAIYGLYKAKCKVWSNILNPYVFLSVGAMFISLIFYDFKELIKVSLFFLSCYLGFISYLSAINKEILIKRLFLSASLGSFVYLLLTYHLNFNIIGLQEGSRLLFNIWAMDSQLPATCLGLISSISIIYSFYLIFCDKSKFIKIVGVMFLLFTLYVNITTASRTPIVLFVLIYAFMFWTLLRSLDLKKKIGLIVFLCILASLFMSNFVSYFQGSSLGARFEESGLETSRWNITIRYFDGMLIHLWGGGYINEDVGKLAHNFIQESYDLYGILFFIPLIFICFGIIKRDILLYKDRYFSNVNIILLGLSIGLFIQNMLEPTITGFPQILWILFMVDGIVIAKFYDRTKLYNPNVKNI